MGGRIDKEVEVFEESKHAQIQDDAEQQESFATALRISIVDGQRKVKVDHGRQHEEPGESPVPPTVEDVAGQQQHAILHVPGHAVIQHQYAGQEDAKLPCIEEHVGEQNGSVSARRMRTAAPHQVEAARDTPCEVDVLVDLPATSR